MCMLPISNMGNNRIQPYKHLANHQNANRLSSVYLICVQPSVVPVWND